MGTRVCTEKLPSEVGLENGILLGKTAPFKLLAAILRRQLYSQCPPFPGNPREFAGDGRNNSAGWSTNKTSTLNSLSAFSFGRQTYNGKAGSNYYLLSAAHPLAVGLQRPVGEELVLKWAGN